MLTWDLLQSCENQTVGWGPKHSAALCNFVWSAKTLAWRASLAPLGIVSSASLWKLSILLTLFADSKPPGVPVISEIPGLAWPFLEV